MLPSHKATCPGHGPYTTLCRNRQKWPCTEPSLQAHTCTHMHACTCSARTPTLGTAHMHTHMHILKHMDAQTHTHPHAHLSTLF